jgi:hypothetical protein
VILQSSHPPGEKAEAGTGTVPAAPLPA